MSYLTEVELEKDLFLRSLDPDLKRICLPGSSGDCGCNSLPHELITWRKDQL
jgi:hypothetical protein